MRVGYSTRDGKQAMIATTTVFEKLPDVSRDRYLKRPTCFVLWVFSILRVLETNIVGPVGCKCHGLSVYRDVGLSGLTIYWDVP